MTDQPSKPNRRFTIFELVAYVSSFAVVFGAWRVFIGMSFLTPGNFTPDNCVIRLLMVGFTVSLFGAIVGLGVAVLAGGRRWAVTGAVVGSMVATAIFVCGAVVYVVSLIRV